MPKSVEKRLLLCLDNPFDHPGPFDPSLPREVLERHENEPGELEALLLASMHALALGGASFAKLLSESALPVRLERRLPRPRVALARMALASARAVRHLNGQYGSSAAMARVRRTTWAACFGRSLLHGLRLERVVREHDVVITGETGTGKEGVARAIGLGTAGDDQGSLAPFCDINAAAVPDTLIEAELFGHAKGAFTGASGPRMGLVRSAHGGCLFLDEVGDLPLQAQVKLLRVIESDRVQPLGEGRAHQVDVRFVAATHRDLPARVREGAFRADLYQRIAGVVIHLVPLRERPEDIAVIGERFVDDALSGESFERDRLLAFLRGPEARKRSWPGNVRELQNVLRNLLLGLEVDGLLAAEQPLPGESVPPRIAQGHAPLDEVELWYARRALERAAGNLTQAARVLGIDRTTLARRLERA